MGEVQVDAVDTRSDVSEAWRRNWRYRRQEHIPIFEQVHKFLAVPAAKLLGLDVPVGRQERPRKKAVAGLGVNLAHARATLPPARSVSAAPHRNADDGAGVDNLAPSSALA